MYIHETKVRVRYAETDQMGYCYYGNYAQYFEVARVEALRNLGISYKQLEEDGVMLPVTDFSVKYFKPAFYDDLLTVKTMISTLPRPRLTFEYEILNESGEKLNVASTILVFINKENMRPTRAPEKLVDELKKHIADA